MEREKRQNQEPFSPHAQMKEAAQVMTRRPEDKSPEACPVGSFLPSRLGVGPLLPEKPRRNISVDKSLQISEICMDWIFCFRSKFQAKGKYIGIVGAIIIWEHFASLFNKQIRSQNIVLEPNWLPQEYINRDSEPAEEGQGEERKM